MLSLGNTYSESEVTDFYELVKKALNEDFEICFELKYDGTSISLTYEDGKLVRACCLLYTSSTHKLESFCLSPCLPKTVF